MHVIYLLAYTGLHEQQQVDETGWKNRNKWNPNWDVIFHTHRVDEPFSFVRGCKLETLWNVEFVCVGHWKCLINSNHYGKRNWNCKIAKSSSNLKMGKYCYLPLAVMPRTSFDLIFAVSIFVGFKPPVSCLSPFISFMFYTSLIYVSVLWKSKQVLLQICFYVV